MIYFGPGRFGVRGRFSSKATDLMTLEHQPVCPHCNQNLQPFKLPDNTGWETEFHLACFNDECPYFLRGWEHMEERYAVKASYRYRIDPASGKPSPLGVWSADAIKDSILDAAVTAEPDDTPDEGSAS